MKQYGQPARQLSVTASAYIAILLLVAAASTTLAQEEALPETQYKQLKKPAQQVETINQEEEDKQDKAGSTKSQSVDDNQSVAPADLETKQIRPELKGRTEQSIKKQLPAVQKDKLPAVQQPQPSGVQPLRDDRIPDIISVTPESGAPGSRVRLQGRHLEPAGDGGEHILTLTPPGRGSGNRMEVHIWTDTQIVAEIPADAHIGAAEIVLMYPVGDGAYRAKSIDFEVLDGSDSPLAGAGKLPADAGKVPIPADDSGGGFVASEDLEREPATIWFRGITSGELRYGHRSEIRAEFHNDSPRAVYFMPAYQFSGGQPKAGRSSAINLPAGISRNIRMTIDLRPSALNEYAKEEIAEKGEILFGIFAAKAREPRGSSAEDWVYSSETPGPRFSPTEVKRAFEYELQLVRLTKTDRCEKDWARNAEWEFMLMFGGLEAPDWVTHAARQPNKLDPPTTVRSSSAQGPITETYRIRSDADNIVTAVRLYALKDDGNPKKGGLGARFDLTTLYDHLIGRTENDTLSSIEPSGTFCGTGNLQLSIRHGVELISY